MPQVGTPYVESVAVMAKYSPFAEKAGMKKIAEQQSVQGIKKLTHTLKHLGIDLQLIGSQHYVESKLKGLSVEQIKQIKDAFIANKHPRFKKEVASSRHQPYGKSTEYVSYVKTADNLKICRLIKVFSMLSQTKVYLFWGNKIE